MTRGWAARALCTGTTRGSATKAQTMSSLPSAEYHYYRTYGVGAQAHVSHFDRCAGQSNNICCMKFHDLITNPNSGHQLFVEKCAFTGLSYSAVDRNAGAAEKQHSHEKRPRMVVAEDWFDLICRCSRTKPFIVHRFDQKAHRRWVKKKGARVRGSRGGCSTTSTGGPRRPAAGAALAMACG